MNESDIRRFWAKVDVRGPDECWPWTAARSRAGYGLLKWRQASGQGWRMIGAHRVSLMIATGQGQKDGQFVLHSCDNPCCCNPKHLRFGTPKDNSDDAWTRGRATPPPLHAGDSHPSRTRPERRPRGATMWNQTLTEAQARQIFSLHMAGATVADIAARVGCAAHAVADVVRGRSWSHLHGTEGCPTREQLKGGGQRRSKLTAEDQAAILQLIAAGQTNKAIAARFGVSTAPISNLRNHGRTW